MSATVRPDNLRAALDAKLAAAMSRLVELREAEQPSITAHLNPREIIGAFLLYARGVYPIVNAFGRAQAGDLQFDAWYGQWMDRLGDADRTLWNQLRDNRVRSEHPYSAALIDIEILVATDPSVVLDQSLPGAREGVRKLLVRFASSPDRAASGVCDDYLRLTKRFAADFVRDHARFLP